jgi:hypothetical protein
MKRFLLLALMVACAGAADDYGPDAELEVGSLAQAVGIKTGLVNSYGTIEVTGQPHRHARCPATGAVKCSVPRTKGPSYFIDSGSLNANEAQIARSAVGTIDMQVNWKFTETTDPATATLTFNRLDGCNGEDIQGLVCVDFTEQHNTLSEPTPIPNTYTEHTKGVIHVDRSKINACRSCGYGPCDVCPQTEKNKRMLHGFQAAIVSWMGLGVSGYMPSTSPANRFINDPDDTGLLTAAEVCKLNGFLPAGQLGTSSTISIVSNCNAD